MLSVCRAMLANKRTIKHHSKLRHRFRNPSVLPLRQTAAQRRQTVEDVMRHRRVNPGDRSHYRYIEDRLYSQGARLDREGLNLNTTYALQGLGDLEPLRNSRSFGFSEREALKYNSPQEAAKYEAPPMPFTPLAARKLTEGKLWPAAPEPTGMMSKEVRLLRNRKNMSPSAQTFSDKIAFHLRRSLRACPPHIGEHMDFAQLIIKDVLASRRSKEVYIVWSTIDLGARFELEPQLHRLNHWVQRLIMQRIRTRPNIPHISWIYDGGQLDTELDRGLVAELKSHVGDARSTLEERVKYLKELDTVNQRMKDVPWFMPYLWNKEDTANRARQMRSDLNEYEKSKGSGGAGDDKSPARSVASQMSPPPFYVR